MNLICIVTKSQNASLSEVRPQGSTANVLKFELEYERNLLQLLEEINQHHYQPGRSVIFIIIDKPVKPEIFAADFRNRITHSIAH